MERDIRRDRGQWRGCYSFKDIILDGEDSSSPKRNGGLKMGHTYYYYYELDGSTETYDPSLPSTTACPYLPGQTVNALWVPVEQSARKRSGSLNSIRDIDFKTMNPEHKFVTPRPAPSPPLVPGSQRLPTSPALLQRKRSARSISPSPNWVFSPRKLFSRKASASSLRDPKQASIPEDQRSIRSSEGSVSRDMSPESLRRFLIEDAAVEKELETIERPSITIPEDIAEEAEENDDDDNFATSATSETVPFTVLSPPPTQRSFSPSPQLTAILAGVQEADLPGEVEQAPARPTRTPPSVPRTAALVIPSPESRFSISDSSVCTADLPESPDSADLPSFYHSDSEDEDAEDAAHIAVLEGDAGKASIARNLEATLSTYSLPRVPPAGSKLAITKQRSLETLGSPALVARNGNDMPLGNTSLLTSQIPNSGLDDLVNELGWMADVIAGKVV